MNTTNFKKPNIKMSDAYFYDLANSSVKVIELMSPDAVFEQYKQNPVRAMWAVFNEVNFQKKNPDTHPSFKNNPNRRVVSYDKNFDAYEGNALNDNHIQSAMKSIFNQIFQNKYDKGGNTIIKMNYNDFYKAYTEFYRQEHKYSSLPSAHVLGSIYDDYVKNPDEFKWLEKYKYAYGGTITSAFTKIKNWLNQPI